MISIIKCYDSEGNAVVLNLANLCYAYQSDNDFVICYFGSAPGIKIKGNIDLIFPCQEQCRPLSDFEKDLDKEIKNDMKSWERMEKENRSDK